MRKGEGERESKDFYMQGGGKGKLNTIASNQPTVYMFLPMEVISSPQQIPVVQVNDLTTIPSAQQVRHAISNLYKKTGSSIRSVQLC